MTWALFDGSAFDSLLTGCLQGFFTYLYATSIVFFLYVFGYLLRSKRHKERKNKLRKVFQQQKKHEASVDSVCVGVENEQATVGATGKSCEASPNLQRRCSRDAGSANITWNPSGLDGPKKNTVTHTTSSSSILSSKSKKMKVSENEHSHGSLFLRAGAVSK